METLKGMGFTSITFQHFYGLYRAAGHHLPQVFLHEPDSGVTPAAASEDQCAALPAQRERPLADALHRHTTVGQLSSVCW